MAEEPQGRSRWLYAWWLAVATIMVRLWFDIRRVVDWRHSSRRQRLMVVLSALVAVSTGVGVTLAVTGIGQPAPYSLGPSTTPQQAATANRTQAAVWIAQQVSSSVSVSCDPQMCRQVRQRGFPAGQLMVLPSAADGPLGSSVVVGTPALRNQFGARLATVYAPLVIASFGSGAERVDIRAVAPDGAAAFRSQLAAEHTDLIFAGQQLLRNQNIQASPSARAALLVGHVDPSLLVTFAALASKMPLRLVTFDDSSPGASSAVPLRGAEISAPSPAAILTFLHAQQPPYLPATAAIARSAGGQSLVAIRFDAQGLGDIRGF